MKESWLRKLLYLILFIVVKSFFNFTFYEKIFLFSFCQLVRSPGLYVESSDISGVICTIIPDYGNWIVFKLTMW